MKHKIKQLEENVRDWAEADDAIRVVLVIGSHARRDHPADDLSDLDLIVFSSEPQQYLEDDRWLHTFGNLWVAILEQTGSNVPEWLAIYEGGEKIDIVFFHTDALRHNAPEQINWRNVSQRGVYVLVDKDDLTTNELPQVFGAPEPEPPTVEQFTATVDHFWYEVAVVAKSIKRRELWTSYERDLNIKRHLRRLIEWQAQAHGRDTWHDGRFMMEWADTQVYTRLRDIFFQFDSAENWQALLETMSLFREVAQQVAANHNFDYPQALDDNISQFVENVRRF